MKRRILMGILVACLWGTSGFAQTPAASTTPTDAATATSNAEAKPSEAPKSIYDDETLKPRDVYNLVVEKLAAGDFATAIEGFSRARDDAAYDNTLRFAAAYNLGHAYAQKAAAAGDLAQLDEKTLQTVVEDLSMSVYGFRDAVSQRAGHQEAAGNLEIVLKRLRFAKDLIAQKYNVIDKQLDEVIAIERSIRESARGISDRIRQANAERDPVAYQEDFRALARVQLEALTQANLVAENLAISLEQIEGKPEDQRSQEEAYRGFQLKSADPLLESARQAMAGARRQMRELSLQDSLRLTNRALNYLKQAREQLEDPLAILSHLAEDEGSFVRLVGAKHMFRDPELLAAYQKRLEREDIVEPLWLTGELLTDNQVDAFMRTNRLAAFLSAVIASSQGQEPQTQDPQQAEAAKRQIEQMKEALPLIQEAASAMQIVTQKLEVEDYGAATREGDRALKQLTLAMERFADLKHLIEIAYATQTQMRDLVRGKVGEDLISRAQQREVLAPALSENVERLERLAFLLAREASQAAEKASQGVQGQAPSEEEKQKVQQMFEYAETLRQNAQNAMGRMAQQVAASPEEGVDETVMPTTPEAAEWSALSGDVEIAQKSLEELRILFFSVIEHIQELLRQQSTTLDDTTDASTLLEEEQTQKIPVILDRQRMHELTSDKIAEVLTQQAESIRNQGAQGAQSGVDPNEMAQRYTQAASELQVASTAMRQVQADLQTDERHFDDALEQQAQAVAHIQKALEYLQPPQPQQQQQNQQNSQSQQNQQDQQQQQQQKMSKEQMDKKLQQARSRDKERRQSKEARGAGMPTVEKDW